MIRFAICDDEPSMVQEIYEFISSYMQEKQDTAYHISRFSSGCSLLESLYDFDVIFLDVQMEQLDGMETAVERTKHTLYSGLYNGFDRACI